MYKIRQRLKSKITTNNIAASMEAKMTVADKCQGKVVYQAVTMLVFVVLGFFIYSNTLKSPFVFDDWQNIQDNPHIRLTELTLKDITEVGIKSRASHRPVANISFALNYYLHRYNVVGYHCVNIIIHILAGIFLYSFIKNTLSIPLLRDKYGDYKPIAYFVALLWLVHPLQTQSVTYIVQRMTSMAAMFYILSLLLYVKGRLVNQQQKSWPWFAGCIVSGLLALGSKEIAATLPVFILLYEWYFFQDLKSSWLKRYLAYVAGIFVIFGILGLLYLGSNPFEKILSGYSYREFTLIERLLTQPRVVVYYISLLFYPNPGRLNLDYDFAISHSLLLPVTTLPCIGIIAGFIGLAVYIAKKERLVSFCILWFFGNLVIESSFLSLELVFEHRLYLPSMLVCVAVAALAWRYIKQGWVRLAVFAIVTVVFCVWTYQRNSIWRDAVTLFRDCVAKSPEKARPHVNLGDSLMAQDKSDEAIHHYRQAVLLGPNDDRAHFALGIAVAGQGKLDEAIKYYARALQINPFYAEAHCKLGVTLESQGKPDDAIYHYRQALQIRPDYADAHNSLGNALASQGKLNEAIGHYRQVLQINAELPLTHYNLGNALVMLGQVSEALKHLRESQRLDPDWPVPLNKMAWILATCWDPNIRDANEAIRLAERAAELTKHQNAMILNTLAAAYASAGRLAEAVPLAEKALALAQSPQQSKLAEQIRQCLRAYKAGRPYVEPAPRVSFD